MSTEALIGLGIVIIMVTWRMRIAAEHERFAEYAFGKFVMRELSCPKCGHAIRLT